MGSALSPHPVNTAEGPCVWLQIDAAPCSVDTMPAVRKQPPGSADSVPSAASLSCTGQQRGDEKTQEVAPLTKSHAESPLGPD